MLGFGDDARLLQFSIFQQFIRIIRGLYQRALPFFLLLLQQRGSATP